MESMSCEAEPQWMLPTEDQVRLRAYEIYQARAGGTGSPEDDWAQAQRELTAAFSAAAGMDGGAAPAAPKPKESAAATADGYGTKPPMRRRAAQASPSSRAGRAKPAR